jgi:hypothetical protein
VQLKIHGATRLNEQLSSLRLLTVQEHYPALASEAAQNP